MTKKCILQESQICNECGKCLYCDIETKKICDNCCKCIETNLEYNVVDIDNINEESDYKFNNDEEQTYIEWMEEKIRNKDIEDE